jgi:putative sigma-54 modulation protein
MTIPVTISAKGMTVNERLQAHIEKKVGKLDRYLPELRAAQLDLVVNKAARNSGDRKVAQITLQVPRTILRAEEHSADFFASVDKAVEKVYRQIERHKGRQVHSRHMEPGQERVGEVLANQEQATWETHTDEKERVVRRKRFALSPMNEQEAIEQMASLGHESFFVFYNVDTASVNVVYRRHDSGYGLIIPEIN